MSTAATKADQNRTIVTEFNETVFDEHDLSNLDEYLSPDVVQYDAGSEFHGIDAIQEYFEGMFEAFPDVELQLREMVADDEWVMFRFEASATNEGDLTIEETTIPATGKPISWEGAVSIRMADGKFVEIHVISDRLAVREQLGIVPPVDEYAA